MIFDELLIGTAFIIFCGVMVVTTIGYAVVWYLRNK